MSGDVCAEAGFLAPELQILPGHALGVGSHGGELLVQLLQSLLFLCQVFFQTLNPLLGLLNLGHHAAGAVLLAL